MGLDIVYHQSISDRLGPRDYDAADADESLICLVQHNHFERQSDGLVPGLYRSTGESDAFRAGSYGSYGRFRTRLWRAANPDVDLETVWSAADDGFLLNRRFELLCNFSDCEGFIGPVTSAKLAEEFNTFENPFPADEYEHKVYEMFKRAFNTAANTGVVVFC